MEDGITAVILCGGLGTRLRAAVQDRPKFLAEVNGRPFAHYVLHRLAPLGVRQAVLSSGYLGDQVEATLGRSLFGLDLVYSRETEPLGTAGALRAATEKVSTPLVLVLNGDSYCDASLARLVEFHGARSSEATLLLAHVKAAQGFGRVALDADGRILAFKEKLEEPGAAWVNAGVYLFRTARLAGVSPERPLSLEYDVLPRWIDSGLYGYPTNGRLLDIGTPATLHAASAHLAGVLD